MLAPYSDSQADPVADSDSYASGNCCRVCRALLSLQGKWFKTSSWELSMSAQGANQRSQTTQQQSGSQQSGLVRRSSSATLPSLWMDPGDFINPFALIRRMQDEMSRALGRGDNQAGVWAPAIELEQRDGNLVVQ